MNPLHRAEKLVYDALVKSDVISDIYKNGRFFSVFQSYVAPNSLASLKEYILIDRISAVSLDSDYIDGTRGDTLRRVLLQIDVCDLSYDNVVVRAELVKDVLKDAFGCCIDSERVGYVDFGKQVWNVVSIDINLTESEVM